MYSKKIFARALSIKDEQAKRKKGIYASLLQEAKEKSKELTLLDLKIRSNGAKAAALALAGDFEGIAAAKKENDGLIKQKAALQEDLGIGEFEPECKLCNDTGYVGGAICGCVKEIARDLALKEIGSAAPITSSRFDNFDINYYPDQKGESNISPKERMTGIFAFCKDYADSFNPKSESILFLGGTGLGKTHLSLAIAGEVINKGYGVIYGTAQNLFNEMSREHFSYGEKSDALIDECLDCDLLIIDDLGTEFCTQFTLSAVYNIVNTRLLREKPTLISTNYSLAELEKIYSPRILSRIIGNYTMKKFYGNDIRQIKAVNKLNGNK